jgi:hypothetical protein
MHQQREPGWSNPKVLTIFALIFLCGSAFGAALTRGYLHRHLPPVRDRHEASIESAGHFGLEKLKTELNLTPEQSQFITQELDDYRKYYQNIEEERLDVAEHGKQRILDRLNDQQKRKFNDLFSSPIRAAGQ